MPGRLNLFQRTMLRWDEMYPYNAAHVIELAAPLDAPRLRETICRTLAALGIGALAISENERSYDYAASAAEPEFTLLQLSDDPLAALTDEIERQINTRFLRGSPFLPVRFFAAEGTGHFHLGLVYFHPAADGEAAVHLLRDLAEAYLNPGTPPQPLEIFPTRRDLWYRQPPALLARKFASLLRLARNMRQSRRPRRREEAKARNGITFFTLTQPEFAALARASKAWNATINDLFLALLLKCALRLAASQPPNARRPWLSVGCIVNLRKDLGLDSPRTFGLFLGSFFVTHRGSAELGLRELAGVVQRETARVKRHRLYLGAPLEMAFARWWLGFVAQERRDRFYHKHFPLWGGISNMNLNPLWPGASDGRVRDYFRAVSTGPVTPLVFSLTSFGPRTNVGVSYRAEIYSPAEIELAKTCFVESVRELQTQL